MRSLTALCLLATTGLLTGPPATAENYVLMQYFHWYLPADGSLWLQVHEDAADGTGKNWDRPVDTENGNYDYLLCAGIDLNHPEVIAELKAWGEWYLAEARGRLAAGAEQPALGFGIGYTRGVLGLQGRDSPLTRTHDQT